MRASIAERGFGTIDVIMAVVVASLLFTAIYSQQQDANTETAKKVVADHLHRVSEAASGYIRANYASLRAAATATTAATFTVADMRTAGFLPSGFQALNAWGQGYTVYVLEPSANKLQAIILTSGGRGHNASQPEFASRIVPGAAALAGARGGYVPTGVLPSESSAIIQGAYGGWRFPLTGTNIPNPGAGHLAAMLYFEDGNIGQDFLYRVAVPGSPELNAMTTTLDMSGHTIYMGDADVGGGDQNGTRSVNFEDHSTADFVCDNTDNTEGRLFFNDTEGLYICREGQHRLLLDSLNTSAFKDASLVANRAMVPFPACQPTETPQIFVSPVSMAPNNTGRYIKAYQTWAEIVGTSWRVNLEVLTDQGWVSPDAGFARLMVLTKCSS